VKVIFILVLESIDGARPVEILIVRTNISAMANWVYPAGFFVGGKEVPAYPEVVKPPSTCNGSVWPTFECVGKLSCHKLKYIINVVLFKANIM
jgi:hypothetical protein